MIQWFLAVGSGLAYIWAINNLFKMHFIGYLIGKYRESSMCNATKLVIFNLGIVDDYLWLNFHFPPPPLICYLLSTWQLTTLNPYSSIRVVENSFSWGYSYQVQILQMGLGYSWSRLEALWLQDHQLPFCDVKMITFDCRKSVSCTFSLTNFFGPYIVWIFKSRLL